MEHKTLILLKSLLNRMIGCSDPNCPICKETLSNIQKLGSELELTEGEVNIITPAYLKRGR